MHARPGRQRRKHNPALRHHFASVAQQKNSASLGMWLFLVTEIMFFGGMFCAYLIYRLAAISMTLPSRATASISSWVLETRWSFFSSSLTVVLAVNAAQRGKLQITRLLLDRLRSFLGWRFWE